jgi:hypothetical protein
MYRVCPEDFSAELTPETHGGWKQMRMSQLSRGCIKVKDTKDVRKHSVFRENRQRRQKHQGVKKLGET